MAKPQILDSDSTVAEINNESFTSEHVFTSPLAQLPMLDTSYLASVTDEQIEDYGTELDTYEREVWGIQKSNYRLISGHISDLIKNMYGSYSKQYKYFARQTSAEVPCLMHYGNTPNVRQVASKVKEAKLASAESSKVVLADKDMSQIDSSIQYLLQSEYQYGIDFTATNAVSMAKTVALKLLTEKSFNGIIESSDVCSDICSSTAIDVSVTSNGINAQCACGEVNKNLDINIAYDSTSNSWTHKLTGIEGLANG